MKSIIFIASLFSSAAFATTIDLQSGNSITIKAGDTATITCNGGTSGPVSVKGTITGICNGNQLALDLDTATASASYAFAFNSGTDCKNVLGAVDSEFGDFTGLKIIRFCSGNTLNKVRFSADLGTITNAQTAFNSSTECKNAL